MNSKIILSDENINPIFEEIKGLINTSRNRVYTAVNTEMLNLYWDIGKIIMQIQEGNERAAYGDAVLEKLSEKLTKEFGKGFSFVGNQVRITLDDTHFYPDLVLYNRILKCFIIIDLKIGEISPHDIGQMQMYVNYYDRDIKSKDENKTIGILLSTKKRNNS